MAFFNSNKKSRQVRRDKNTSNLDNWQTNGQDFSDSEEIKQPGTWFRRLMVFLLIFLVLIAGVGGAGYWYLKQTPLRGQKEGRINILVVGIDKAARLADTIILVSVDTRNKEEPKVAMISIPRDLAVPISGFGTQKINGAYSLGETASYSGTGVDLIKSTVSKTFDQPIHYYVAVDFEGFKKAVDAVGGVDINVKTAINDPFFPNNRAGYQPYSISAGPHHLDGTEALKYARSRQTSTDFDRAARQQQIILALKDKTLSSQTLLRPDRIAELQKASSDHINTDIELQEAIKFVEIARKLNQNSIRKHVLNDSADNLLVADTSNGYKLVPKDGNFESIIEFVRDIFLITSDTLPQTQR